MAGPPRYDVLIVGGGMVGASLACALGGQALRVAVVEAVPHGAATQPSYDDRSIALAYGTRRIFEGIGLWNALAGAVTPIERIHVSDRGHFGAARMEAAGCGFDALGYVVETRRLGEIFSAELARLPNVDLICPAELQAFEVSADGVRAHLAGAGPEALLTARLVVAADGGRSTVRRLAGIGVERRDYGQCAVIANVTPQRPHCNTAFERFTASGPLALLPMSQDRCSLVWTVDADRRAAVMALSDEAFLAALQERFGHRLGRFVRVGRRAAYPLTLIRANRHTAPRLALIGNAAHTLHPIAGQGFNLGLRDVAVLAQVLVEAVATGRDIGDPGTLAQYDRARRRDQRRVIGLTDGLVRIFSNDFTPLVVARNLGMVALDILPPLKRMLMRQTMGLGGRLPRLARGLPL